VRSHIVMLLLVVLPCIAARAAAQNRAQRPVEIPLDFRRDGAWRVKARRVAAERGQLLSRGDFSHLNALRIMGLSGTSATLSGVMSVPLVLFYYHDTDPSAVRDTSEYSAALFAPEPPLGRPYTLRSYFEQLSNSLFSVRGQSIGWAELDSNEVTYTGQGCTFNPYDTSNCNGIFSSDAARRMQRGLRAALDKVDGRLDFVQFDNDGPDGIPNSGDDDGYVDLVIFATPTQDGACGGAANNHMWSHQSTIGAGDGGGDYVTNDAAAGGGNIRISDYLIQAGLGGSTGCDATQLMPIGQTAQVLGFALGLPTLFDATNASEGIGLWGLMGAGGWNSPDSPSRMEAWSLNQLGWVSVVPLTATGTYTFGAVPTADTVFLVRPTGANPRGEYFLLENRQAVLADTALIRRTCERSGQPPTCPGGLLVWHIDPAQIASVEERQVNTGPIHGVALMQADGLNQLRHPPGVGNRGDAGDPFPGTSGNVAFSGSTNPAAVKNEDGSFAGFAIDQIRQTVPGGEMTFRLRLGQPTVVRASDKNAVITVDGVSVKVFQDLLAEGSTHTISVADTQLSVDARTRWRFASWSDGGTRTHDFTAGPGGDTITATLSADYKIIASAGPGGTVSASPPVNLVGEFRAKGNALQLTATPSLGFSFGGWSGDTTSNNPVLTLAMERPYTVMATFLTTNDVVAQLLGSGSPLSSEQLLYLDSKGNHNGVFDIGDFLAWLDASGAAIVAQKGARP
jgi:M6 family metalloprotease-like protein